MNVLTSDEDTAELYVQIFRRLAQCAVSSKCRFIWGRLSGRLREPKNRRNVQLGSPNSGRGRLREPFFTKFKLQFKRGFINVVLTRAGRFKESFDCTILDIKDITYA